MKKIFILLFLLILVAGVAWLGLTQPQIEPQPIDQSIDTAQFIGTQE
jgi:hypothetical protein|tara:strand:+ start:470 stop:610 length:141 start_codon:yes stop_codon:yes gene_type:complete